MILHALTEKTGDVAGMVIPEEHEEDILIISSSGTIIRTAIEGIRRCGRASQGVIVMRAQGDEKIISIAAAAAEPEETDEVSYQAETENDDN